eukprot:scaffold3783_cov77-Phaeocystis_antarctica.AAC.2
MPRVAAFAAVQSPPSAVKSTPISVLEWCGPHVRASRSGITKSVQGKARTRVGSRSVSPRFEPCVAYKREHGRSRRSRMWPAAIVGRAQA